MRRCCSAVTLAVVLAGASSAQAQELLLKGPLKGASVGRLLWRERRVEIAGATGVRVSDAANPAALLLGELRYYPLERVGLGTWGAVALFDDACSSFCAMLALPELAVLPIIGQSQFLGYMRYDVHLVAAPAWVWPSTGDRLERQLAAGVGGGFRGFWSSSFSTSVDYRALVGTDVAHLVGLSVSWWPTERRWDNE
jgi:hypothetical protein